MNVVQIIAKSVEVRNGDDLYEIVVGICPICNGVVGIDATFLDQVDEAVRCPFCSNYIVFADDEELERLAKAGDDEEVEVEVDLIASGYEWTCPQCGNVRVESEGGEYVNCPDCRKAFGVGETRHALP